MSFENGDIVLAGILHPAVGMMNQAGRRLSRRDRLFQCTQCQTRGQGSLQLPASTKRCMSFVPADGFNDHFSAPRCPADGGFALRHQLGVLQANAPRRLRLKRSDRRLCHLAPLARGSS